MPMTVDLDIWDNIREDKLVRQILCYLSGGLRCYPYIYRNIPGSGSDVDLNHVIPHFSLSSCPAVNSLIKGYNAPKTFAKKKEGCIKKATS